MAETYTHPACGKSWGGLNTAHCTGCCRTFSGLGTFDMHRRGGKCLNPETITDSKGEPAMVEGLRAYQCWSYPPKREGEIAWYEVG